MFPDRSLAVAASLEIRLSANGSSTPRVCGNTQTSGMMWGLHGAGVRACFFLITQMRILDRRPSELSFLLTFSRSTAAHPCRWGQSCVEFFSKMVEYNTKFGVKKKKWLEICFFKRRFWERNVRHRCIYSFTKTKEGAQAPSAHRDLGGLLAGNSQIFNVWMHLWETTTQRAFLRARFFCSPIAFSVFFHIATFHQRLHFKLISIFSLFFEIPGTSVTAGLPLYYESEAKVNKKFCSCTSCRQTYHKGSHAFLRASCLCAVCQADSVLNTHFDRVKGKSGVEIDTWTPDSVLRCGEQQNMDVPVTYEGKHLSVSVSRPGEVFQSAACWKCMLSSIPHVFISLLFEWAYYFIIGQKVIRNNSLALALRNLGLLTD